ANQAGTSIAFTLPEYAQHIKSLCAFAAIGTPNTGDLQVGNLYIELDKKLRTVSGGVPYGGFGAAIHTGGPSNAWWVLDYPLCNPLVTGTFRQPFPSANPFTLYLVFDTAETGTETENQTNINEFIQEQINEEQQEPEV